MVGQKLPAGSCGDLRLALGNHPYKGLEKVRRTARRQGFLTMSFFRVGKKTKCPCRVAVGANNFVATDSKAADEFQCG